MQSQCRALIEKVNDCINKCLQLHVVGTLLKKLMTKTLEIKLNNKELSEFNKLVELLKNQNNRCARTPVWFVLQDAILTGSLGSGDLLLFYHNDYGEFIGDTEEDIINNIYDQYEEEYDISEKKRFKKDIKYAVEGKCKDVEYYFEDKAVFLTEKAANDHLLANRHHYTSKVRIYVKPVWRNPEMELVHKILLNLNK